MLQYWPWKYLQITRDLVSAISNDIIRLAKIVKFIDNQTKWNTFPLIFAPFGFRAFAGYFEWRNLVSQKYNIIIDNQIKVEDSSTTICTVRF